MIGRAIALAGVVAGLVAIWVKFAVLPVIGEQKYWDDGTFGGLLLILAVLTGLLVLLAIVTRLPSLDLAAMAVGGTMLGLYLLFPALFAFDQWKYLDIGAWLGLCSGLTVIGGAIAAASWAPAAGSRPTGVGMILAAVGAGLVLAGIWTKTTDDGETYWNVPGFGHSLGIAMIILLALTALSILAAFVNQAGYDAALALAAITLGLTIAVPVSEAFNDLGRLRSGGWLAACGGILLMLGVLAMRALVWAPVSARVRRGPRSTT